MVKKTYDRMDRIGDLIQRNIATLLREEFKDPRVQWVTVASVEVSRDLSYAKIYITVLEDDKVHQTLKILNRAAGFFRSHLAKKIHLRIVPELHFLFDDSTRRGIRITSLLEQEKSNLQNNDPDHNQSKTDEDKDGY